jgi:hypothetical protein
MIKLGEDRCHKVIEPLKQVTINNLFARSVVERHVTGISACLGFSAGKNIQR